MTIETVEVEQSHIVFPAPAEGVKALALCGKKWKPAHIDDETVQQMLTCPTCVRAAVRLLKEADTAATDLLRRLAQIEDSINGAIGDMLDSTPQFNATVSQGLAFAEEQAEKQIAKAAKRAEKDRAKTEALLAEAQAKGEKKAKKPKKG